MSMYINRRMIVSGSLVSLLALSASTALGQSTKPDKTNEQKQAQESKEKSGAGGSDEGILAGPKVDEEALDANRGFGEGDRARREVTVPSQAWFRMLNALDLTEEQKSTMREIVAAHQREAQAYLDANIEKMREFEAKVQAMRTGEMEPDRAVAQELNRIRNGAPKVEPVQEAIWAILTEEQQSTMKDQLAEARARIEERAAQRRAAASSDRPATDRANPDRMMDNMMDEDGSFREVPPPMPGEVRGPGMDERGLRRLRFLRSLQRQQTDQPETDRATPQRPRRRSNDRATDQSRSDG